MRQSVGKDVWNLNGDISKTFKITTITIITRLTRLVLYAEERCIQEKASIMEAVLFIAPVGA